MRPQDFYHSGENLQPGNAVKSHHHGERARRKRSFAVDAPFVFGRSRWDAAGQNMFWNAVGPDMSTEAFCSERSRPKSHANVMWCGKCPCPVVVAFAGIDERWHVESGGISPLPQRVMEIFHAFSSGLPSQEACWMGMGPYLASAAQQFLRLSAGRWCKNKTKIQK